MHERRNEWKGGDEVRNSEISEQVLDICGQPSLEPSIAETGQQSLTKKEKQQPGPAKNAYRGESR
jgi:hypothetical protein